MPQMTPQNREKRNKKRKQQNKEIWYLFALLWNNLSFTLLGIINKLVLELFN